MMNMPQEMSNDPRKHLLFLAVTEEDQTSGLQDFLEANGYQTALLQDTAESFRRAAEGEASLIIVSSHRAEACGTKILKNIRLVTDVPVLILSEAKYESSLITALNDGADGVLYAEESNEMKLARIKALLRRVHPASFYDTDKAGAMPNIIRSGVFEFNPASLQLRKRGKLISLTPCEYRILHILVSNPGKVYSKAELGEYLIGNTYDNYENAIMVHISHLRDKIEDDPRHPRYIVNTRGKGYHFNENGEE